ncbi:MAG TPA: CRISPR-associated endonuclease Cas2 [Saprospiraceae bacterium]|nr:CRISPR-associated endonuclease Cas2 [Saprospiraceae bacterium]
MTNYLISYDIADDKLRTKAAKILQANACKRVQKSVFLAQAFSQKEIQQVRDQLGKLMQSPKKLATDSILCWPASDQQISAMRWEGDQPFFDNLINGSDFLMY